MLSSIRRTTALPALLGRGSRSHSYSCNRIFSPSSGCKPQASYTTRSYTTRSNHIDTLMHNPELDAEDICNELRWMKQALPRSLPCDEAETALDDMVKRRSEGEPLQYILGNTDFGDLTLLARAPVLIPRPETAHIIADLAERILSSAPGDAGELQLPKINILDLCTGSGCIPLLLSHLLGPVLGTAFAVDISPHAVALAQDNIAHLGMAPSRVNVIQADILAADFVPRLKAATHNTPIHIITSNPPYICADEYAELPRSVREYEDRGALLAGPVPGVADGVAFYAHIARLAPQILTPLPELHASVPRIAVEIGVEQGAAVSSLLPGSTQVVKDQYGLDRMVVSML